jgi:deazaflavin-dependent oxidoreductase (nitroreductase family)
MITPKRSVLMTAFWKVHRWIYDRSGGRIGSSTLGKQIVRLTIIGRKSGQPRSVLLYAFPAGDSYAVVASNLGDDAYPLWYLNLKANPAVTVEDEGKQFEAVAREAEGEERERLWAGVTAADPTYTSYQKRTERVIPVIVLEAEENLTGTS